MISVRRLFRGPVVFLLVCKSWTPQKKSIQSHNTIGRFLHHVTSYVSAKSVLRFCLGRTTLVLVSGSGDIGTSETKKKKNFGECFRKLSNNLRHHNVFGFGFSFGLREDIGPVNHLEFSNGSCHDVLSASDSPSPKKKTKKNDILA
jgi:hypothetical protein